MTTENSHLIHDRAIQLRSEKFRLPLKAVRIELLDEDGKAVIAHNDMNRPIGPAVATGFLVHEPDGSAYVYTCWHVVTGIDMHHPALPGPTASKRRMALRLTMQGHDSRGPGEDVTVIVIGGSTHIDVPLYDTSTTPPTPLWEQDEQCQEDTGLSIAGLAAPFWHDVVRIRLQAGTKVTGLQVLSRSDLWQHLVVPGDGLMLVGYPYGYSTYEQQPTPIVLRRHVAAVNLPGTRRREVLLDGGGAPGMSGGPVFFEGPDRLYLFGLYTGIIFPDSPGRERSTTLGSVCNLSFLDSMPLVQPIVESNS